MPFLLLHKYSCTAHYPEANTNDDAVVTRDMNTACGANAGRVDGQSFHIVEGANPHDKENDEQYAVVWDGSGLSLTRRG